MSPTIARRRVGIKPVRAGKASSPAVAQLMKAWPPKVGTQPLPDGQGGRVKAADLGIKEKAPLSFLVIGDHGGVKDPQPQNAVALAMEADKAAFLYSVGDVVYFNGAEKEYGPQFYEAYCAVAMPIVAIPGNHDGDTTDDPSRAPLDTFMAHFCASKAALPVGFEEYNRDQMTQPYCDWTLLCDAVTIIGLYTNVPSGGHLERSQVDWLAQELKAAPKGRPVIVTLHHPPLSIDAHHGGSAKMSKALDHAFDAAGRDPELVLSGHVHDYQRLTRTDRAKPITYVVIGNSGYHNTHKLAPGATAGQELVPGIRFDYGDDTEYGYLRLTVDGGKIGGEYVGVTPGATSNAAPQITRGKDTFMAGA